VSLLTSDSRVLKKARVPSAEALSKNGPLALIASKQVLQQQFDWSAAEMWQKQADIVGPVMSSEDAKEGATAFKEKRDPAWKGR